MITLTRDQVQAVEAKGLRTFVLAPAGSGKTEVLVQRVLRVLQSSRGDSFRVLALTFTLKAAEELRVRVREAVGEELWRVEADTIHGFALNLLRRFGTSVGLSGEPVVYSEDTDRLELVHRYLASFPESISEASAAQLLARIDEARTSLVPRASLDDEFVDEVALSVGDIYDGYVSLLDEANGLDFPAMLTKAIQLADTDERARSLFRRVYRHVVVDEGQDLTAAQSTLLSKLITETTSLFVVGDERQSIYGYAGGDVRWAWNLVGEGADVLRLRHNFRSSLAILDAAAKVADHFEKKRPEVVLPDGTPPGLVEVMALPDERAEANFVASWVRGVLTGLDPSTLVPGESPAVAPKEIAVVARSRYVLEPIRDALLAEGIWISVQTAESDALRTPEARLLIALLHLAANTNDRPAARRATEELRQLDPEAVESRSWIEALEAATERIVYRLKAIAVGCRAADSVDRLPADMAELELRSADWADDRMLLASWVTQYLAATSLQERSLRGFLHFIFRVQRTRPEDPGVRLLTTHRAKGLEFTAVAIVGLVEGTFPDFRSKDSKAIDEERRTFYVALTRARRALLLTWPETQTSRYGRRFASRPSRFLIEAQLVTV